MDENAEYSRIRGWKEGQNGFETKLSLPEQNVSYLYHKKVTRPPACQQRRTCSSKEKYFNVLLNHDKWIWLESRVQLIIHFILFTPYTFDVPRLLGTLEMIHCLPLLYEHSWYVRVDKSPKGLRWSSCCCCRCCFNDGVFSTSGNIYYSSILSTVGPSVGIYSDLPPTVRT